jgi:hypothetical protein
LPSGPETKASLPVLNITTGDFVVRGVTAGDLLALTSPAAVPYNVVITSVAPRAVVFTPAVVYEAGSWAYSVRSAGVFAHSGVATASTLFVEEFPDTSDLDVVMSRLSRGGQYSSGFAAILAAYSAALVALRSAIVAYTPARESSVDHIVEALQEQGLDRALDLFLALQLVELFAMHPDEVSYSTAVIRRSADAARELTPESRFEGRYIRTILSTTSRSRP